LQPYNPNLDDFLLVRAAHIHEFGEAELKRDICHLTKTKNHDLDEATAVAKRFACLGKGLSSFHYQAFLLQFVGARATKGDDAYNNFSENDQAIMNDLWENKKIEALIFQYSERLEYILFALEQGSCFKNYIMVEEVLRNHIIDMRQACELIPGWAQEVWTPNIDNLAQEVWKSLKNKLPKEKLFMPNINKGL
jgi:hypothetical protein